jgi:sec-independent protein translocase protein TatC
MSVALLIIGIVMCQVFVMPKAVEALLWFNEWLGFEPELRLSDWISFAIMMPLVFGLSFQTPLVMMLLNKIGILDVDVFRRHRRVSWMVMAIFAAVITPTVDPFSMLFLWVPMVALYELGIYVCDWQRPAGGVGEEAPHDELVEV